MIIRRFNSQLRCLLILMFIQLSVFTVYGEKASNDDEKTGKRVAIMGLGDSITEGGENFQSYLFPLWEKLFAAGYHFDFIGPRAGKCRIGTLNHCGFSGKTAEFLDQHIDSIYRKYPADIVLLHAGGNHFDTEKPVAGIVAAQQSIIHKIRAINPEVKILVAQVVSSGKLPKYSYIPELNAAIAKMVKSQHSRNVILVNQFKGFDWQKHTIGDKVHPNPAGAEKMAKTWFAALQKIMPAPKESFHPEIITYKQTDQGELKLHVFRPAKVKAGEKRPAIIYFFGGVWTLGTPLQFYRECAHYASKGMVAISAEYRISYLHKTTPFESVEDARDVIRWLRANAKLLNINPNQIVAAGASAGGHLAAVTGIIKDTSEREVTISSNPNLLLLYYPAVDNSANGVGPEEMKKRYCEISPLHNIDRTAPPSLFLLGTKDELIPVKTAEEFKTKMEAVGVDCELHLFEGAGHPIFYYAREITENYTKILELSDAFLRKYRYLNK